MALDQWHNELQTSCLTATKEEEEEEEEDDDDGGGGGGGSDVYAHDFTIAKDILLRNSGFLFDNDTIILDLL